MSGKGSVRVSDIPTLTLICERIEFAASAARVCASLLTSQQSGHERDRDIAIMLRSAVGDVLSAQVDWLKDIIKQSPG